jgi:hypothetical protein
MQESLSQNDQNLGLKKKTNLPTNGLFSINQNYQSNLFQKSFLKEKLFSKSIYFLTFNSD